MVPRPHPRPSRHPGPSSGPAPAATEFPGYPGPEHRWWEPATGLHVVDQGTGDMVLMLHGNPAWSYMWRHLVTALAGTFRCVAPDHLGMGLSHRPGRGGCSFTDRLDHLDALAEHLIGHRGAPAHGWTLAVHDWGGPIGLAWARRHPGLVTRLVVLNSVGFRWPPDHRLPRSLTLIRDVHWLARAAHLTNAFPRAALRLGVTTPLPGPVRRAYLRPYRTPARRRAVIDFVRRIPRDTTDPVWSLVDPAGTGLARLPVFIGWGLRDPVFTPAVLREWRRRFPHAEVHAFREAGHFVLEDAGDALIAPITRFLTRDDPPSREAAPGRTGP